MAMAMPPRLMVLRLSPNASSTSIVTSSDSGRVIREMTVVRKLARKTKSTMTTKMAVVRKLARKTKSTMTTKMAPS